MALPTSKDATGPQVEKHLQILKEMMRTATDLRDPVNYFFTTLGDHPAFLELGAPGENLLVSTALEQVGRELFGKKAIISGLLLIELPEYGFFHGPCFMGGRPASVFFFSDTEMGMGSVLKNMATSEVDFIRFTATYLDLADKSNRVFFGRN